MRISRAVLFAATVATLSAGPALGATVGVYYYPWYGPSPGGHHYDDVMRMHLTPGAQPPALGTYNSRDPNVIATHIDQSHTGSISMWSMSWWGPNTYEDVTIRNNILILTEHPVRRRTLDADSEAQPVVGEVNSDRLCGVG